VCFSGKSGIAADKKNADRVVRFVAVTESSVSTCTAADVEDTLTAETSSSHGTTFSADPIQSSSLFRLICDSCWLSYQLIRSRSSAGHLWFLAAVLRSSASSSDRLLTDLMSRAEISMPGAFVSVRLEFLEQMILPLVEQLSDSEGSGAHILSIMSSIYAQLRPGEQVSVMRDATDRAAQNNRICADFLSEVVVSANASSGEVRCWLRGEEFGRFVVQLTEDVCRRRLMTTDTGEVADESMVNDQPMVNDKSSVNDKSMANDKSMDDSHWKLLCACLRTDQESGSLHLFCNRIRKLLAGDAQAKLALSIAQIYLNGECIDSVHLSVCPRQLESVGDFYSSKLQRGEY